MASWVWAHLSTVYVQTPGRVPALLVRRAERGEWVLEISFRDFLAAGGQLTPRATGDDPWAGWVVESPRAVPLVAVPGGPVAGTPRGPEQQAAVARAAPAAPAPCASYCAVPSVTPPTATPTYPPAGGCGSASAPGVCVAAPSAPTGEAPPSSTLPPTPRPAFPADLVPWAERLTSQYRGLSGIERLRRAFRAGLSDRAALRGERTDLDLDAIAPLPLRNCYWVILRCAALGERAGWTSSSDIYFWYLSYPKGVWDSTAVSNGFASEVEAEAYLRGAGLLQWPPELGLRNSPSCLGERRLAAAVVEGCRESRRG